MRALTPQELDELFKAQESVNQEQIESFRHTQDTKLIKFTNPLRDYSHLLTGRFICDLIGLESFIKGL